METFYVYVTGRDGVYRHTARHMPRVGAKITPDGTRWLCEVTGTRPFVFDDGSESEAIVCAWKGEVVAGRIYD